MVHKWSEWSARTWKKAFQLTQLAADSVKVVIVWTRNPRGAGIRLLVRLFVIDSLLVLHSTSRRAENRQQEIADISNGIKALAKELKAPMIVLSQLNRELEKRTTANPDCRT